jgi:hypothetical protein
MLSIFIQGSTMSNKIPSPLPDFEFEPEIATDLGVCKETLARARKDGKFQFIEWAGRIFDKRRGSRSIETWLHSKVTSRNPPRASRRRPRQSSEIRGTAV